jgi:hypothetical protein
VKCPKCDHPKKLRAKLVDFDYSITCGIPGTVLVGVKQYACPKCRTVFQDLGDADAITDAITDILLAQQWLNRSAVKFIRTHLFQENYFEFSKRVGVGGQLWRDVENSKRPLTRELSQRVQDEVIKFRSGKVRIVFDV